MLAALALTGPSFAADNPPVISAAPSAAPASAASPAGPGTKRCTSVIHDDRPTYVTLGKSTVIPLDVRVARVIVSGQPPSRAPAPSAAAAAPGAAPAHAAPAPVAQANANDGVADMEVMLLSPTDLFFRGKVAGSMNVVLQNAQGACFIKDIIVSVDSGALQAKLTELMPEENRIKVRGAERAIVLTGEVSDALKLDDIMSLATSYGDGKKVVNLLRITSPQQVMLEVKIAEVSKTLLDRLGSSISARRFTNGGTNTYTLISSFLSGGGAFAEALRVGKAAISLDGQKDDGLVRVLAEPNIMAISGQQASFLSGGKIFIPVAQSRDSGGSTVTLEEKAFGVGLKFS
ncbi:MAG: BON domain-containing protein, partial [Variovorax sp.]